MRTFGHADFVTKVNESTIICAKTEPLCYYRCCHRKATLQCDYRIDHWGNTCDAGMCEGHSAFLGYGRIRCDNHESPENQGRMAL